MRTPTSGSKVAQKLASVQLTVKAQLFIHCWNSLLY